jgi:MFS family permease
MKIFSSLTKEQKEAIGILQIGTFLEYFDLMLYVHMAIVLNELFFPKTDPYTSKLIATAAFGSTFVFRPFGALVFGYIGDNIGRKPTVIITTVMMALSCTVMANLPTYAQIGVTASWAMIICRITQGMSSMGEIIGAEIYLTELIKPPARYPAVCLMDCAAGLGSFMALGVASAVFIINLDWRVVFWIGALIAVIGAVARNVLRETPDFVNAKRKLQNIIEGLGRNTNLIKRSLIVNEKVNKKTALAYFLIQCGTPLRFYFAYIYSSELLKNLFNYSGEQIVNHNLVIAIVDFLGIAYFTILSHKIHPLKIVKATMIIFLIFTLCTPYLLYNITSPLHLMIMQCICVFGIYDVPAHAIFFTHFPIFKRFTYASFMFALSRALMYSITSFVLVYITEKFGHWGLWIIYLPVIIAFKYGLQHFENLEKNNSIIIHTKNLLTT